MINIRLQKNRFTPTLAALLIIFLISACSNEDNLTATTPGINTDSNTDINTKITANNTALISGIDSASVTEDVDPDGDNLLEAGGRLNITDSDAGEAAFTARTVNGNYGRLTINTTGYWNYAANNNQAVIQNLNTGATLTDRLTISSVDGTTHTVLVTIVGVVDSVATTGPGTNTPAVIKGVDRGGLTEDVDPDGDNLLEISGKLNITDSDAGEAVFSAKVVNGDYGRLMINTTGYWIFAANNNQSVIQNLNTGATLTDRLRINSVDGTAHTVVVTIKGVDEANNPALITGLDRASVTEDVDPDGDNLLEVGGRLNITDSDAGEATFIAKTVNGNYGRLTINTTGNWIFAANNNQTAIQNLARGATLTDRLRINSVDGTVHTVVITIKGVDEANNPALITGLDRASVTEDVDPDGDNLLEVGGRLNITDSDAGEATFIAKTVNGNYGRLTINTTGNWIFAANNNQAAIQNLARGATLTDRLNVNSVDGTAHTVAITILGADENNKPADITLSWVAPAEREDNSALSLSAIAGYKVYYGTTQGQYSDSVAINDGTAVAYTFTGLPAGTYYFVVTTIDTDGRESQYSSAVTLTT